MIENFKIKEWVKGSIKKGYTNEEIAFVLIKNNYPDDEIKELLAIKNISPISFEIETKDKDKSKTLKKQEVLKGKKLKFPGKIAIKREKKKINEIPKNIPASNEIKDMAELIFRIKREIAKVIIGQEDVVDAFICALLCDGHVLLEGVPGIAKTLIVKTLAKVSGGISKRIQFTVDLLPSDIIGIVTYTPQKGFQTIKGPIFANFIIADEINRSPPKTQSALIEAMQEKQVTIGRETYKLPLPFFVMANNNPLETSGVYDLPEAQIDRFLFKLHIGYPDNKEEEQILEENVTLKKFEDFDIKSILSPEKIFEMQKITKDIYIDERVRDYIVRIVDKTRKKDFEHGKYVEWGASPRAGIGLFIASKAWALMHGRNYVIPKDVKEIAHFVLRHRLILNYKAKAEGVTSDVIIDEVLNMVDILE